MLLKKKQVHTPPSGDSQPKPEAANLMRAQVKRKGLATLGALLLLISVAILGTIAWYTRVSNVTGMTMDVAKFDFNANYAAEDDTFIINVGGYLDSTLTNGKAAPGTKGVIPIRMSSGDSDTAVSYSLNLDFTEMADEFQNRLRFYYYTNEGTAASPVYELHVIEPSTATQTSSAILGTLAAKGQSGEVKYEYIYWEWVYELDDDWFADNGKWYHKKNAAEVYDYGTQTNLTGQQVFDAIYPSTEVATKTDLFDEFDTELGTGKKNDTMVCHYSGNAETKTADANADGTEGKLYAYQKAMMLKLHVTGAQAKPVANGGTDPVSPGVAGTAVYKSS